jgi:hypothetical protein
VGLIPNFTSSGTLPPFYGTGNPVASAGRSPYLVTPSELVARFATSTERNALLTALFAYRQSMRAIGITDGFQWLDGSFVEDAEAVKGRAPSDIDLVTFAHRPIAARDDADWANLVNANLQLFQPGGNVGLDTYYVDLELGPQLVVRRTAYWFGLFTHQKVTGLWKGVLQLDLGVDDSAAIALLGANP